MDEETVQKLCEDYPENFIINIQNISSFYNYRTIESDKEHIYSSIFSNKEKLKIVSIRGLDLEKIKNDDSNFQMDLQIIEEQLDFKTLHNKVNRIEVALKSLYDLDESDLMKVIEFKSEFEDDLNILNNKKNSNIKYNTQFCITGFQYF